MNAGTARTTATVWTRKTSQVTGRLDDPELSTHEVELDTPDQVEITLSGPPDADLDLHVPADGRAPTADDSTDDGRIACSRW